MAKRKLDEASGLNRLKIIEGASAEVIETEYHTWCKDMDLHDEFERVVIQERKVTHREVNGEYVFVLWIFHRLDVKD